MVLIPKSVLGTLQRTTESGMPDTVFIERPGADVEDEGGGRTEGPPTTTATVGRIGAMDSGTAQERERAGQVVQDGTEKLVVPMNTDVRGTDRVVVTSARHGTTTRYTVEQVVPLGTYSVHRTLIVKPEA